VDDKPFSRRGSGVARYDTLVELARGFGVVTPEDPYLLWPGSDRPCYIVPLFTLYDYTFRPDHVRQTGCCPGQRGMALSVVMSTFCTRLPTRIVPHGAWHEWRPPNAGWQVCPRNVETILISHFPLRRSHAVLPRVPRFVLGCGTRATENWPTRFRARAVIFGHLHIRRSFEEEGISFHEVSLGYPRRWDQHRSIASYPKVIL